MADSLIQTFTQTVIRSESGFTDLDRIYVYNRIWQFVGQQDQRISRDLTTLEQVDALVSLAVTNGAIPDTLSNRDQLAAQLMDLTTPQPSAVNAQFWNYYQTDPRQATDWFYALSQANDYIKTRAIAKNVVYTVKTADYGTLQITINLSKPEKDPKDIAAAKDQPQNEYPQCQLCLENEGYIGRAGYPARANHRVIRLTLGGETWGFQYSPYAYFNEHAIFLSQHHRPMHIDAQTFSNLLEIVTLLPEYFVGSNADLPIVGGSMLSHDHYQGGRHRFPMMDAPMDLPVELGVAGVTVGTIVWPMTAIRLVSQDRAALIEAAVKIHEAWRDYSDETVDVRAWTAGERHHTTTPIAYRQGRDYVMDIVLRDNQTSAAYPDGIFHPHPDVQHIKKENIGLIEVMGRAILPARLKPEMAEVVKYVLGQPNEMAAYHRVWADTLKTQVQFTPENATTLVNQAVGQVFARVLADAGVFKRDDTGQAAFARFIVTLN